MQRQPFTQTEAYILKRHPYREHHYLLDVFTAEHGRFRASARLAKQKTYRMTDLLAPFHRLHIDGQRKSELATIFASHIAAAPSFPPSLLLNACYINELILTHLPIDYADADIYAAYRQSIADPHPENLRRMEQSLLQNLYQLPDQPEAGSAYRIHTGEYGPFFAPTLREGYPAELIKDLLQERDISSHPHSKSLLQTLLKLHQQGNDHTFQTATALKNLLKP